MLTCCKILYSFKYFIFSVPPKDLIAPVEHVEVQDLELPTSKKKLSLNIGSNATVISGKVVVLRCPTKGSVKPNITWYSGNKLIVPSENYAIRGDSLVIAQQREGEFDYKCKVETFLGETEMTSKLKIVGKWKDFLG